MQKDFITATPDSGAGGTHVNVTAAANTGDDRTTTVNITGGGITKTVSISQAGIPPDILGGWADEVKYYEYPIFMFPDVYSVENGQVVKGYYELENGKSFYSECQTSGEIAFVMDWGARLCTFDFGTSATFPWKKDAGQIMTNGTIIQVIELAQNETVSLSKPDNSEFYIYINDTNIHQNNSEITGIVGVAQIKNKLSSIGWAVNLNPASNDTFTTVTFSKLWVDAPPIFFSTLKKDAGSSEFSDSFSCVLR